MMIALAVNPRASFGRGRHAGDEAAGYFRAAGAEVLVLCEDSYDALARAVDKVRPQELTPWWWWAATAWSTSASMRSPVRACLSARCPLGIVPTGTGNDMARALGVPLHNLPGACAAVLAARNPAGG